MRTTLKKRLITTLLAMPLSLAWGASCTPNLTPEQAYLAINHPSLPHQTRQNSEGRSPSATATTLPNTININTASEAELTQLEGIGAKKAQAIILYRQMIAPFGQVDELDRVRGIGKATVDKNRHRLTVH